MFQCSSASRKFLNTKSGNASLKPYSFQCSSASRKFLNVLRKPLSAPPARVSVLFSEPKIPQLLGRGLRSGLDSTVSVLFSEPKIPQHEVRQCILKTVLVSVLFSEPKIPQLARGLGYRVGFKVSVLFSEPKIPQPWWHTRSTTLLDHSFSALQRAENSSTQLAQEHRRHCFGFSALQRAENSSTRDFHGTNI